MNTKKFMVALVSATIMMAGMQSCGDSQKMKELEKENQELQENLDKTMADYNAFKAQNAQYTDEIVQKDSVINAQAEQIRKSLNSNGGSNYSKNKKIKELQSQIDELKAEIERLKAENEELKAENQQIKEEVETANNNVQKLNEENSELNRKVQLASILVTSDVTATPEKKKCCGNSFKATDKASSVQRIRVAGKLMANNVVEPGTITIYVRIAKGSNLITNGETQTFNFEGTDMQYTASQDVEFYGQTRAFAINWKKAENTVLPTGAYTATIYANSHEIGKTNFSLK